MQTFTLIRTWVAARGQHVGERGQATVEYALIIMGLALFLVVAAFALQPVLANPVARISTWIGAQNAP
ncbi:MAG TPA: hypothetical protein VFL28_15740 [bacterium]|nr:hypothetical protein [bacterium]